MRSHLFEAACLKKGIERLRDVKAAPPPYVSFEDIKLRARTTLSQPAWISDA